MPQNNVNINEEKNSKLVDFSLNVKGLGKLIIQFDAKQRVEKLFNACIDKILEEFDTK